MVDSNWWRAQHLELIPPEGATLIDRDEEMMIAREDALNRRLNAPQWNSWPRQVRVELPPEDGKGKGKKGKRDWKGKNKKGKWNETAPLAGADN